MKAIITLRTGAFANLFGLTFDVVDIHVDGRISLNVKGNTTDFSFKEVLILDLQNEIQHAFDNKNWNSSATTTMPSSPKAGALYYALNQYRVKNKIEFIPIYHCPA